MQLERSLSDFGDYAQIGAKGERLIESLCGLEW